ncbi:HigA family addiction module antitoxin [Endozoicomonas sp. 8E]|uniref:HigA family addiction module antitoxin n=1 Tax=Endozoicomonas sp. 8E TaxID=3035692 RepID=UPI0029393D94|nr:HigA family addiction module antitoxin [Endozoicomonas sp. 8E]WOG30122.1 HigA family addiction module antitoxin [Endozoicomonas sp. 8E]
MSDLAIPPGEYLEEVLEEMDITQAELARRMGRPPQAINEILKGEKAITPETALQLEQVVGVPAYFWSSLESEYRLVMATEADERKAEDEIDTASAYPYSEIAKLGLVKKTRKQLEKVKELRKFFGVSSLFNIQSVKEYAPAFRQVEKDTTSHEALASWLRAGHVIASKKEVEQFNKLKLQNSIPKLRQLTFETEPNLLLQKLSKLLAECGIALVLIPHFSKTYTTGATYWIGKHKAVIMMSLRGSWSDIFWFSLLHEIGHILLHDKRITFLENASKDNQYMSQETEADSFAQKTLIPESEYLSFLDKAVFTRKSIHDFSSEIGIFPGIVTGRLQYNKKLPHTSNFHRVRFKWKEA